MVIGLYGAMALVALVIAAGRGDPDLYRFGAQPHWPLLAGPAAGIAVGLAVVGRAAFSGSPRGQGIHIRTQNRRAAYACGEWWR